MKQEKTGMSQQKTAKLQLKAGKNVSQNFAKKTGMGSRRERVCRREAGCIMRQERSVEGRKEGSIRKEEEMQYIPEMSIVSQE
jgi:hypothetical protein